MPVSTLLAATASKAFTGLVVKLSETLSQETKRKISQWNTENKAKNLYNKIRKFEKVKTIWQVDKAIPLAEFFCPPHIRIGKKRKKASKFKDFEGRRTVLLEGIAGQGKSIFMRNLCIEELKVPILLPIFFELRRYQGELSLFENIKGVLEVLGLSVDIELFKILCNSGIILLLFDGFDEVPENVRPRLIGEIESLINVHDSLNIIISSRPNTGLNMVSSLEVVRLENLAGNEYEEIIDKISESKEYASTLKKNIKSNQGELERLLCTPLIVTLLVMLYRSYQEIPSHLSDFYSNIFQVLISRHDGTKPGYHRPRSCELNDSQYRSAFEAFCISSKEHRTISYTHENIYSFSERALKLCSFKEDPEKYLTDIVKITCLLLKEGDEYRFIHKSVQEYFAAAFISKKPEAFVQKFYEKRRERVDKSANWEQELHFLSELDEYRYNKYYMIPVLQNFLPTDSEINDSNIKKLLTERYRSLVVVGYKFTNGKLQVFFAMSDFQYPHFLSGKYFQEVVSGNLHLVGENMIKSKLNGLRVDQLDKELQSWANSIETDFPGEKGKFVFVDMRYVAQNDPISTEILDASKKFFTKLKAKLALLEKKQIDEESLGEIESILAE